MNINTKAHTCTPFPYDNAEERYGLPIGTYVCMYVCNS